MRLTATVLAVLCAVAAGCGGDDGGDGSGGDASARAAYIEQGDAICRKANAEIAATNARINQIERSATSAGQALKDAAPLLQQTADDQRASVAEFRALNAPDADQAQVEKIVAGITEQVALVGKLADAAQAGDAAQVQALGAELAGTRDRVRSLFQGFGFAECGRAGGSG